MDAGQRATIPCASWATTDYERDMLALAEADAADAGARYPQILTVGGEWHGLDVETWAARMNVALLDPESVIEGRGTIAFRAHEGAVPIVEGDPGRSGRGLERVA